MEPESAAGFAGLLVDGLPVFGAAELGAAGFSTLVIFTVAVSDFAGGLVAAIWTDCADEAGGFEAAVLAGIIEFDATGDFLDEAGMAVDELFDAGTGKAVGVSEATILFSGEFESLAFDAGLPGAISALLLAIGTTAGADGLSVAVILPATLRNLSTMRFASGVSW